MQKLDFAHSICPVEFIVFTEKLIILEWQQSFIKELMKICPSLHYLQTFSVVSTLGKFNEFNHQQRGGADGIWEVFSECCLLSNSCRP